MDSHGVSMNILLQKQERGIKTLDIENRILKNILDNNKQLHQYTELTLTDFMQLAHSNAENVNINSYRDYIPVGSIEFVSAWMQLFYNHELNPVEIPKVLRTEEFLKRDYKIVRACDLPKSGRWFIKDVSQLKAFSMCWDFDIAQIDRFLLSPDALIGKQKDPEDTNVYLNNTHLFQVSELLDILAEYRIYIIDGMIENVCLYNGSARYYPDMKLIDKTNLIYSIESDWPCSYTIDVAVTSKGTHLLEIHPFACIGLYSTLWPQELPYAYKDGINYYIQHNSKVEL